MLLNTAICQGHSFYHFWVIKGKPTRGGGGVKLPPPTQIILLIFSKTKVFGLFIHITFFARAVFSLYHYGYPALPKLGIGSIFLSTGANLHGIRFSLTFNLHVTFFHSFPFGSFSVGYASLVLLFIFIDFDSSSDRNIHLSSVFSPGFWKAASVKLSRLQAASYHAW